MSIQSEIDRISIGISNAYNSVMNLGGLIPEVKNVDNLSKAIDSITSIDRKHIYGVVWDENHSKFIRTDGAENFTDPVPAIGNGSGSSPFDKIRPWSGMLKVEDSASGDILVSIPKYYLKVSNFPFSVQISPFPINGFVVDPSHRDRGDGKGERDVVYIGRYECDGTTYGSTGNPGIAVNKTLSTFRDNIKAKGNGYYQADYAIQLTIWFLYLVEYANWDSQLVIGKGVVNYQNNYPASPGLTDNITYHTGRRSEDNSGGTSSAIQYRWIENLWGNTNEFRDGIIINVSGNNPRICTYDNPNNFTNNINGVGVKIRYINLPRSATQGYVKTWQLDPNDSTFLFPLDYTKNIDESFIKDYCIVNYQSYKVPLIGGFMTDNDLAGIFAINISYDSSGSISKSNLVGSRIQKLP